MCGLAGILNLSAPAPIGRESLVSMIATLRHRGPDGFGYYQDDSVGLAHARLSIIDLKTGDQPIRNETGTVWVVFNGEIFNYVELRQRLQQLGHVFYTQSDTEVIVHAYEEFGDAFARELNGQFAIALWDKAGRRLLLVRDRVGIRPLVYTQVVDRLYFASEAKSLFAIPAVPRALDVRALGQTCTFWSPLSPRTAFAGIHSVPPGNVLVAEGGQVTVNQYWDWQFPVDGDQDSRTSDECIDELRELLRDATRLQLRADVPVGSYLSGGLDSSAITAMIRRYSDAPLRTFSLTFADSEFDESGFQSEVAGYLGTDHHSRRVTTREIGEALPQAIYHIESGLVRTAAVPLMLLAEAVRATGFKVVLTGEGADEVFAGYDLFKEAKIRRFWAKAPQSRWRPKLLGRLYGYLAHSPAALGQMAYGFFGQGLAESGSAHFAHAPRWQTTRRTWRYYSKDLQQQLDGWDPVGEFEAQLPPNFSRWSDLSRDQYVEAHTLLSNYLLHAQGDRVALAHSVEGRYPFLDHRVIEFANRLRPRLKLKGLKEKWILREAVADLLPASIVRRTKQPYRAPDSASLFVAGKPLAYVSELLSDSNLRAAGYFEPSAVGKLLSKGARGAVIGFADNQSLVAIVTTMLLHQQFVAGDDADAINPHRIRRPIP